MRGEGDNFTCSYQGFCVEICVSAMKMSELKDRLYQLYLNGSSFTARIKWNHLIWNSKIKSKNKCI